ncbi:MAG: hypothetical protein ACREM1_13665 [Longimicrobiales bacterium]
MKYLLPDAGGEVRFREIVRYEIEHRVRSPSTWMFAGVLFGLGFLMMSGG